MKMAKEPPAFSATQFLIGAFLQSKESLHTLTDSLKRRRLIQDDVNRKKSCHPFITILKTKVKLFHQI